MDVGFSFHEIQALTLRQWPHVNEVLRIVRFHQTVMPVSGYQQLSQQKST